MRIKDCLFNLGSSSPVSMCSVFLGVDSGAICILLNIEFFTVVSHASKEILLFSVCRILPHSGWLPFVSC